ARSRRRPARSKGRSPEASHDEIVQLRPPHAALRVRLVGPQRFSRRQPPRRDRHVGARRLGLQSRRHRQDTTEMITIRSPWLLHHAFGFKPSKHGPKKRAISIPLVLWWECFIAHGWRNWKRGYRDEDAASLCEKLSYPTPP